MKNTSIDDLITFDQLVERITNAMTEMSGEDLALLYNQNFGDGMVYVGDSLFKQEEEV